MRRLPCTLHLKGLKEPPSNSHPALCTTVYIQCPQAASQHNLLCTQKGSLPSPPTRAQLHNIVCSCGMVPTLGPALPLQSGVDKKKLLDDVRGALYASKICSYAQGLNIIRAKSIAKNWGIDMGSLTRIWKVGCFA